MILPHAPLILVKSLGHRIYCCFYFPSISALRAAHSELSGNTGMFRLKLLISFFLLINCRVKSTSTSREECVGSTIPALKLDGSPAPSSGPFQLARVPSARDKISCRQPSIRWASLGAACALARRRFTGLCQGRKLCPLGTSGSASPSAS